MTTRFIVVGLDHRHVWDLVAGLLAAGAECAGWWPESSDPHVVEGFRKRFPSLPEVADKAALLSDPTADFMVCAAVPCDRAGLAVEAMRHRKDVLMDKPGVTTQADLALLQQTVAQTGRIFSICFSERFLVPATTAALRLIRDGAIGRVVQSAGFGPHRLNRALRPDWFFDPAQYGGILADIASHQIDQFLVFTGSDDARIVTSTIGMVDDPRLERPVHAAFENFGEIVLRSDRAAGYCRVDWFTPDGLPTWGDGRLTVIGTQGSIELRKYLDIEGRPGTDHLFLADRTGTRYIDCAGEPITYFCAFCADVRDRTETAMRQSHVWTVCRLALAAQAGAERVNFAGGLPA
ncbi:MAG: Gfo/Idh/MocA family protein [Janthinobacterium lividum]